MSVIMRRNSFRPGWSSYSSSILRAASCSKLSQSASFSQKYGRQYAMLPVVPLCPHDNINGKHVNYFKKSFCTAPVEPEPLIDVLDDYGLRTGETLSRKEIHKRGKGHRAVHFYLFDRSGKLLLQRRSLEKETYPGLLTISVSGHVDAGESSSTALNREIKEEIGLDTVDMIIHYLFSYRQADTTYSASYINCQFNDVYACVHDFKVDDIAFNSYEITELQLIPFMKFQEMIADNNSDLTPGFARESADMMHFFRPILQKYTNM